MIETTNLASGKERVQTTTQPVSEDAQKVWEKTKISATRFGTEVDVDGAGGDPIATRRR
jgi:hypothetical protein